MFVSLYRLIQNRGKADGCAAESNTAAAHVLIDQQRPLLPGRLGRPLKDASRFGNISRLPLRPAVRGQRSTR